MLIGPLKNRRTARDWALVLQSQSIAFVMQMLPEGWFLQVSQAQEAHARQSIALYEEENRNWPPPR